MATGSGTYNGLAVPLFGESEITQQVAGTDIITLTSVADATAANHLRINATSTSALTAGYFQGAYVNMSLGGGITGGSVTQANAFATDITLSGAVTGQISGMYVYIAEGTAAVPGSGTLLDGYVVYFAPLGGGAPDYRAGFHAYSEEPVATIGTMDAALLCESAGALGTWGSVIGVTGITPPSNFLYCQTALGEENMFSTGIRGDVAAAAAWLKVTVQSTVYWIALHASCTS